MIGGIDFDPERHVLTDPSNKRRILSVTNILKIEGFTKTDFYNESAMIRGKAVHLAIHFLEKGTLDRKSIDPIIEPFLAAYELFKKESGALILLTEQRVWHPVLQYGGTLDLFAIINGYPGVIDAKTGTMQDWTKYQVVGYKDCITHAEVKTLIPDEKINRWPLKRWDLELKDNGKYNLQSYTNPNDSRLFQAMVSLAWEKLNSKIITWREIDYVKRDSDDRQNGSGEIQNGWFNPDRTGESNGVGDMRHPDTATSGGHDVGGQTSNQNN